MAGVSCVSSAGKKTKVKAAAAANNLNFVDGRQNFVQVS